MKIEGDAGSDPLIGTEEDDQIFGHGGNDRLVGRGGADSMHGGDGFDRVDYSYSSGGWRIDLASDLADSLSGPTLETVVSIENVYGSQGNDRIYGDEGRNDLEGEGGDDLINGRDGNDTLEGEAGNDHLDGGVGSDTLVGSAGADSLMGGEGFDRFVFNRTSDSSGASVDIIRDFDGTANFGISQDRIDVSKIDSGAPKSTAFTFWGELSDAEGAAKGPGALWVRDVGTETWLLGNTDSDGSVEFRVRIVDGAMTAEDYWDGVFVL